MLAKASQRERCGLARNQMKFRPLRAGLYLLLLLTGPVVFGQPIITDFSPKVGSPGDVITLHGTGFTSPGLSVQFWNGVPVINGFINSDLLITVTLHSTATT